MSLIHRLVAIKLPHTFWMQFISSIIMFSRDYHKHVGASYVWGLCGVRHVVLYVDSGPSMGHVHVAEVACPYATVLVMSGSSSPEPVVPFCGFVICWSGVVWFGNVCNVTTSVGQNGCLWWGGSGAYPIYLSSEAISNSRRVT